MPGLGARVEPNPRAIATLDGRRGADRDGVRRAVRVVGAIALFAALLVVWLVARAERYARERSQFAAAAAHELRTPLAGLQLYGDMLADGLGDPTKLRDYARRMSEEASRLGRVVSNVLGFSQLERGNLSIDPKLGDVAEALRELAEHAQPALDRAGAALELDVPRALDARFDRDALARIVGNLLDNAEKYTRDAEDRTIQLSRATRRRCGRDRRARSRCRRRQSDDSCSRRSRAASRPTVPPASASGSRCRARSPRDGRRAGLSRCRVAGRDVRVDAALGVIASLGLGHVAFRNAASNHA